MNESINNANRSAGQFSCCWQVEQTRAGLYSPGNLLYVTLGISGFILDRLSWRRALVMGVSLGWAWYGLPDLTDLWFCVAYVMLSMLLYLGLISSVLPQHGLRLNWIGAKGEEKAFRALEGLFAFAFFHNGLALTHISQQTASTLPAFQSMDSIITILAIVLIFTGTAVKIWSALVVGLPVYYWKYMFLGRAVGGFVVRGPYRYLANPMYGVGQLQVYGIALYYHSFYGLLFAALNQLLVFGFYYVVERPFMKRTFGISALSVN